MSNLGAIERQVVGSLGGLNPRLKKGSSRIWPIEGRLRGSSARRRRIKAEAWEEMRPGTLNLLGGRDGGGGEMVGWTDGGGGRRGGKIID